MGKEKKQKAKVPPWFLKEGSMSTELRELHEKSKVRKQIR